MAMFFSRGIGCHNCHFHRLQVWRTDTRSSEYNTHYVYYAVMSQGDKKEATHYRVGPNYLPNNIRPSYGSYKVVSMLFIAKAVLR